MFRKWIVFIGVLTLNAVAAADDFCASLNLSPAALTAKANAGSAEAQYLLAMRLAYPEGEVEPDQAEALTWAQRAAEQGLPEGQYLTAFLRYDPDGGRPDASVRRWAQKAAEAGLPEAQAFLGSLLFLGGAQLEALKTLAETPEADYLNALADFRKMLRRDQTEARYWLQRAANQGDVMGQFALGALNLPSILLDVQALMLTMLSPSKTSFDLDPERMEAEMTETCQWFILAKNGLPPSELSATIQGFIDVDLKFFGDRLLAEAVRRAAAFTPRLERAARACAIPTPDAALLRRLATWPLMKGDDAAD